MTTRTPPLTSPLVARRRAGRPRAESPPVTLADAGGVVRAVTRMAMSGLLDLDDLAHVIARQADRLNGVESPANR